MSDLIGRKVDCTVQVPVGSPQVHRQQSTTAKPVSSGILNSVTTALDADTPLDHVHAGELVGVSTPALRPANLSISGDMTVAVTRKLNDLVGDMAMVTRIAELIHEVNLENTKSSRTMRQFARDADIAAQQAAADAIRQAGLLQLFGAVATSAMTVAGAAASIKGAKRAQTAFDKEMGAKPDPANPLANAYRAQQLAQQTIMKWSGVGSAITEFGKIGGAGFALGATFEQEEKARAEAESTKARAHAEDESEFKAGWEKVMNDVLEKLARLQESNAETTRKIIGIMG